MATGRRGFKRSLCVLASAGVAGGLAYVLGNSETAAEVVREIGSLDAEFISKVLGVYAVGAGLASAVTTPYYALKAGYEGIFGCDR